MKVLVPPLVKERVPLNTDNLNTYFFFVFIQGEKGLRGTKGEMVSEHNLLAMIERSLFLIEV